MGPAAPTGPVGPGSVGRVASVDDVTEAAYRAAVGRFATGLTVITASWQGRDHAMTASSLVSVSLRPLLVCVSVARTARMNDLVRGSGSWGVSILAAEQERLAAVFASRHSSADEALAATPHRRGERTGVILLDGTLAQLECRTRHSYDGGDHTILLGDVVSVASADPAGDPLVYFGGDYRGLAVSRAGGVAPSPAARSAGGC